MWLYYACCLLFGYGHLAASQSFYIRGGARAFGFSNLVCLYPAFTNPVFTKENRLLILFYYILILQIRFLQITNYEYGFSVSRVGPRVVSYSVYLIDNICVCIYIYINIYTHVCLFIVVYIYIYI